MICKNCGKKTTLIKCEFCGLNPLKYCTKPKYKINIRHRMSKEQIEKEIEKPDEEYEII